MSEFERIVRFLPGYDHMAENPNRGRGSMRIVFILLGELGATQFMIGTTWGPKSSDESTMRLISGGTFNPCQPQGWDVGYHSPKAKFEGQDSRECDILPGKRCFYDGSSLRADGWTEDFVTGGDAWVWAALEAEYRALFCPSESVA